MSRFPPGTQEMVFAWLGRVESRSVHRIQRGRNGRPQGSGGVASAWPWRTGRGLTDETDIMGRPASSMPSGLEGVLGQWSRGSCSHGGVRQ